MALLSTDFVRKNIPVSISGYGEMGFTRNVLLWQPSFKRWNISPDNPLSEQHRTLTDQKSSAGQNIPVLRPFPVGDQIRISCFEERDAIHRTPWLLDVSSDEVETFLAKQAMEGYHPHSVVAYRSGGGVRFAAVCFKNKEGLEWELLRGVTAAELAQKAAELTKRGFAPHSISVFPFDGAVRYYAVWLKEVLPVAIPNGLTVAKNGRGQFRTIGEALAKVKPGMTIQVLDDATYPEAISIDGPERHAGVLLEAVRGATLELLPQGSTTLAIEKVPRITVRGFRFKSSPNPGVMCALCGRDGALSWVAPEELHAEGIGMNGIWLNGAWSEDPDYPIVVQNCVLNVKGDAIVVFGHPGAISRTGRIAIRDNRVSGSRRGLFISNGVEDVHLTGNIMRNCEWAGISIENPLSTLSGILIANNTVLNNYCGFRLWDHLPFKKPSAGQVSFTNNLLMDNLEDDATYVLSEDDRTGKTQPGDGAALIKTWSFAHNWRDGTTGKYHLPLAPTDIKLKKAQRPPLQTLQPGKDTPLATGGAGGDLPSYVGAVPPEGVPPWDWDKTWKARCRKSQE